ncbi:zinc-dependent alcohol dehydrogenase family protein [Corynebacterium freneyi]|uniref:Enoyl reductase (ER) domain-containing protein n=1 Tax=Corynebacterium freneyi DNF00450 TaxID=1287475 RepID=A0A095Z986_9CORY|nr:zinc-dependent alcohol dehydrogenase family protein [Corynebacterium freneyi]KGF15277.1 hypothetical protein HMPREF1650_11240 [Corynebacterium freneyi DNF00450]
MVTRTPNPTIVAHRFGPPSEVLALEDVPIDAPGPGEVAVRMIASPINPSDLIPVTGAYRSRTDLPFIPGFEGVGVIEEAGAGVDESVVGKRVIPIGGPGAWRRRTVREVEWCIEVPDDVDDERAATAYINPLTALGMVGNHAVPSVRTAVVDAAGSSIAPTLAHLLAARGIRVVGMRRSPGGLGGAALTETSREGRTDAHVGVWSAVIDSSSPTWPDELRAACPDGVDVVFDCVGGPEGMALGRMLRRGGRFVHYGLLSGVPLEPALWDERPDVIFDFFRLRGWVHSAPREQVRAAFGESFRLIGEGVIDTPIRARLPLEEFHAALDMVGEPGNRGKILLIP